jgi:hypothetical protein
MLTTLSSIASTQAEPTKETMNNTKLFLDYAASHKDAIITYQASNMALVVHSDASYLSNQKHEVAPALIFSCHPTPRIPQTTVLYSTLPSSSKQSCLQRPKPNLVHSTSMHARQSCNANFLKKWDTRNHQLRYKPTTAPPLELSTATSNRNE